MQCNVSVLDVGGIKKVADDDTQSVDAIAVGGTGARKIKLSEDAMAIKVAVEVAIRIRKAAHNKSLGVNAEGR